VLRTRRKVRGRFKVALRKFTMPFHVVIVTPEQQVLDETVTQAILPAHDGEIGILAGHAALLVKLGQGRMQLDLVGGGAGGRSRRLYVEGGIAQMKDNELTVLTQMAVPVEEISAESARAEFAEATAQRAPDEKSQDDRNRRLQRARAMQALATTR
jgi:F-type H+-transporting ATPase subunit epsilon